jgi:hypothetical protein
MSEFGILEGPFSNSNHSVTRKPDSAPCTTKLNQTTIRPDKEVVEMDEGVAALRHRLTAIRDEAPDLGQRLRESMNGTYGTQYLHDRCLGDLALKGTVREDGEPVNVGK